MSSIMGSSNSHINHSCGSSCSSCSGGGTADGMVHGSICEYSSSANISGSNSSGA